MIEVTAKRHGHASAEAFLESLFQANSDFPVTYPIFSTRQELEALLLEGLDNPEQEPIQVTPGYFERKKQELRAKLAKGNP